VQFCYSVDVLPESGLQVDGVLEDQWIDDVLGEVLHVTGEPTVIRFELVPCDQNVTVDGSVKIQYRFQCSRCAEDAVGELDVPLQCTFAVGEEDERQGGGLNVDGVGSGRHVRLYTGSTVDLEPVVLERIVFASPRFPVCQDDCKGLCAQCGQNLNSEPCTCQPVVDPRWAKLQEIRLRN